jgi:proteasome assembly chaperone 3
MENLNPGTEGMHTMPEGEDNLLPFKNLTSTTLLGGHSPGQDTTGQLLARQIATAIATKTPSESRLLVVGLGLGQATADRDAFFAIVDLVLQCI